MVVLSSQRNGELPWIHNWHAPIGSHTRERWSSPARGRREGCGGRFLVLVLFFLFFQSVLDSTRSYLLHVNRGNESANDMAVNAVRRAVSRSLVERLPPRRGEYVLVSFVPRAITNFSSVTFLLLTSCVVQQPDVVVHVEVKERTTLSSRLVGNQVKEGNVVSKMRSSLTYMRLSTRAERTARKSPLS